MLRAARFRVSASASAAVRHRPHHAKRVQGGEMGLFTWPTASEAL